MYQKKEKNFLHKMSPHLSQLNVVMAHRNYFLGEIMADQEIVNPQIGNIYKD